MAGLSLLLSLAALADDVVLLDLGPAPEEDALHQELALSGVEVSLRPGPAGFADRPVQEQLEAIRDQLDGQTALLWVAPEPDAVSVAVAFVSEARAVVRVAQQPRDGADPMGALAITVREILAAEDGPSVTAPVIPDAPGPPPRRSWLLVAATLSQPVSKTALGPRIGGEVEGRLEGRPGSAWSLGAALGGELGRQHGRLRARTVSRLGPAVLAGGIDVTALPWVVRVQPRLEAGLFVRVPGGVVPEVRLRLSPVRERVERGDELIYDGARWELALHLGGQRQISGPPRQPRP